MYALKEITNGNDLEERRRLQASTWCPSFSVDQFLLREECLSNHRWTKGKMRTWILIKEENLNKNDNKLHEHALASLETLELKAVTFDNSNISAFGIASVFTESKLRGNGYARTLCEKVKSHIFSMDDQEKVIILFSDIGYSIYSKIGFFAPFQKKFSKNFYFRPGPNFESIFFSKNFSKNVKFFNREQIFPLIQNFCDQVKQQVTENEIIVLPSPEQIDWHFERECVSSKIKNKKFSTFSGASCNNSFIVWIVDYSKSSPCMKILLIKVAAGNEETDTLSLLSNSVNFAKQEGINEIVSWGVESIHGKFGIEKEGWNQAGIIFEEGEREDSLPMMACSNSNSSYAWKYIPRALWF